MGYLDDQPLYKIFLDSLPKNIIQSVSSDNGFEIVRLKGLDYSMLDFPPVNREKIVKSFNNNLREIKYFIRVNENLYDHLEDEIEQASFFKTGLLTSLQDFPYNDRIMVLRVRGSYCKGTNTGPYRKLVNGGLKRILSESADYFATLKNLTKKSEISLMLKDRNYFTKKALEARDAL